MAQQVIQQTINKSLCIEFKDYAENLASSRGYPHVNLPNLLSGLIITLDQALVRMTGKIN